jgi:hypothetical protein
MNLNKILKHLPSFIGEINVNGLIIKPTDNVRRLSGSYVTNRLKQEYVEVPEFSVYNPNDLPYTKTLLEESILEEYRRFFTYLGLDIPANAGLAKFTDDVKDYYIPPKIKNQINECLKTVNFNKRLKANGNNYRVTGEFTGVNSFGTEESDGITWYVDFRPISVDIVDFLDNVVESLSKSQMEDLLDYQRYEQVEVFEDPIWRCVRDTLTETKSFVDFDWMIWSTNIDIVWYKN